jgi:hypothetical protein
MGQPFFDNEMITYDQIDEMTIDNIHDNFLQYATGGVILSLAMGLLGFLTSWGALAVLRKESKTTQSS